MTQTHLTSLPHPRPVSALQQEAFDGALNFLKDIYLHDDDQRSFLELIVRDALRGYTTSLYAEGHLREVTPPTAAACAAPTIPLNTGQALTMVLPVIDIALGALSTFVNKTDKKD